MDNSTIPEVTVAIVFFNAMPHFPLAVQSVLRQTFADFELVLVDDGSTDGSLEYARSLSDPRVRIISDGKNLKLNRRLNQAVQSARGKYFFRMDGDDVMFLDRLEVQIKILRESGENLVLGGSAVCIDENGVIKGFRPAISAPKDIRAARHAFIHPTVCAHTRWFNANPYSEDSAYHRAEDAELWIRTFRRSEFRSIPQPCLFYREPNYVKIENYLGTGFGLVVIVVRSGEIGPYFKIWWIASELLKCWVAVALNLLKKDRLLVARRNRTIPAPVSRVYREKLDDIGRGLTGVKIGPVGLHGA